MIIIILQLPIFKHDGIDEITMKRKNRKKIELSFKLVRFLGY